jgi:hypothetical protein
LRKYTRWPSGSTPTPSLPGTDGISVVLL